MQINQEEIALRKLLKLTFLTLLAIILFIGARIYYDTNILKMNTVAIETEKLPPHEEITVLQITDMHDRVFGKDNRVLLGKVGEADPDIIVLTGDMIDVRTESHENMLRLAEELVKICENVYFVPGNHEYWNPVGNDFIDGLSGRGIQILRNTRVEFAKGEAKISICGSDYVFVNNGKIDRFNIVDDSFEEMFHGMKESSFALVLSHSPKIIEKLNDKPADLVLSGHTHGGQVRLPFIGSIVTLNDPFYKKYEKGLYEFGNKRKLYVDSGAGTSIMPVRFFNQSQISLITIKGK